MRSSVHLRLLGALALVLTLIGGTFGSAAPARALSSNPAVVISQIYGAGGNSGATLRNDYVELFNRSASTVSLAGWSIQYASATGTGNFASNSPTALSGSLAPGQYYLVQLGSGGANGSLLPAADATGTIAAAAGAGKFALVNTTTGLACNGGSTPCDATQTAQIIDLVGYGNANFFEGAGATPTLSSTTAAFRAANGCTDTNSNSSDFSTATPAPRNTASPLSPCAAGPTAPSVNLSVSTNSAAEAAATVVTVTATASSAVSGDQTVSLGVSGTGITGGDYTLSSTTISILNGQTSGAVSFTVVDDADVEGAETATLTISSPSAGITLGATTSQNITIADNDNAPTPVCEQPFTPIYTIQGSGASAALTGNVTTQGVVVGDYEGANEVGIGGFYMQDLTGDANPATSDGIFVFTGTAPGVNTVQAGDVVRVTGFARERFNETALNGSNSNSAAVPAANIVDCGTGSVAPTPVSLPAASSTALEQYEGMLITLSQSLVISEYFNYDRFGEYVLALPLPGESRPYTPTSIEVPGSPAYFSRLDLNLRSRILIDDGLGSQNPAGGNTHPNGLPFSLANSFRGGDTVTGFTGVLGFGFSSYRVQPTTYGTYTAANPRPASPEPVGGTLKVAAFNTLNYFLTLDALDDPTSPDNPADNICGPAGNTQDCRGADLSQPDELARQRAKLLATLSGLNADVVGLIELENTTGVEPMADIVAGLPGYSFVDTGVIGSDTIKVGIIYRTASVQPVGNPAVLDDPAFVNPFNASTDRNRPAVAQTFEEIATGARFTVVVNHLKSKGSGCGAGDDDTTNGQGNCNGTRTAAVEALLDWLATDPTGSNDPDFLIVGDLNSYAQEDPIVTLENAGYTNLIAQFGGPLAYSYAFDGQFGYLDYAMASASLTPQITGMTEWHINADEPDLIDYDTSFKSVVQDGYFAPDAFRSADHDPVLVGLGLDGTPPVTTAAASGATNPLCPSDCFQGSATVTLSASDASGVAETRYRVNNSPSMVYSGPFVITTLGANLVEFFSTDNAGNVEAVKSVTVKVTNFPGLAVLDSFTRANGRLGGSWSGATQLDQYRISGNAVSVDKGGPALWRPTVFGASQEAFLRLTALNATSKHHTLVLKSRGANARNGAILVSYDALNQQVTVEALVVGQGFRTVASLPATLSAGSLLGARALSDGTVLVYADCALLGTADTRTVAGNAYVNVGGQIGVWFQDAAGAAFDDFGGGNIAP